MSIRIFQVDAFSSEPFKGNPACVCLMEEEKSDRWLQNVASEMNLSETAFVWKSAERFRLRWFTPLCEAELCGHATLATAHALWESEWLAAENSAHFDSLSGPLIASRRGIEITLDFPAKELNEDWTAPEGLFVALGAKPGNIVTDGTDLLLELESETAVRQLKPDFGKLAEVDTRGVIVTALSDEGDVDFVSRFFGPAVGIDEDPVTGSAHCLSGPYWAKKLNKNELRAFQASKRGGYLSVNVQGDRVYLGGQATTVFCGQLEV